MKLSRTTRLLATVAAAATIGAAGSILIAQPASAVPGLIVAIDWSDPAAESSIRPSGRVGCCTDPRFPLWRGLLPRTSYAYYTARVADMLWRIPGPGEPAARLLDVTIAEVAEALEASLRDQLRYPIGDDMVAVYGVTAERRALAILLHREDDSFVWKVTAAKPMADDEFDAWFRRTAHD